MPQPCRWSHECPSPFAFAFSLIAFAFSSASSRFVSLSLASIVHAVQSEPLHVCAYTLPFAPSLSLGITDPTRISDHPLNSQAWTDRPHYTTVRPCYRVACEFDGVNNEVIILDPRELCPQSKFKGKTRHRYQ